jgi:hypothetical protein
MGQEGISGLPVKASNVYRAAISGFPGRKDMHHSYVQNVVIFYGINQGSDVGERKANHP